MAPELGRVRDRRGRPEDPRWLERRRLRPGQCRHRREPPDAPRLPSTPTVRRRAETPLGRDRTRPDRRSSSPGDEHRLAALTVPQPAPNATKPAWALRLRTAGFVTLVLRLP